ncbi:MAG: hypothetical protein RI884_1725 [Pseudomonadota bacterium]|jgi:hypothetical protein
MGQKWVSCVSVSGGGGPLVGSLRLQDTGKQTPARGAGTALALLAAPLKSLRTA